MSTLIRSFDQYKAEYLRSVQEPEKFWADAAADFYWRKKWSKVLDWNFDEPKITWFQGAKLNITENCLDRHLLYNGDTPAIIWEPNDKADNAVTYTYKTLHEHVCRFANVLRRNGAKKGDRICIYMPMVPELAIAVLACARIGAIHSVVFGGFSARSIADRIKDASCSLVITADGAKRGAKTVQLKSILDDALETCTTVARVIVLTHTRSAISMIKGRDVWWEDEIKLVHSECKAEEMDAEDMLFILYTSGSTGKPKGVVHTCGGYMVYTSYTFQNAFQYEPGQVYFCTADIGWITGHSYIIYGPLCSGATTLMFEGVPTYPDAGRLWDIVARHHVNIIYTAPTAIRSLMAAGDQYVEGKDLSSLKVLGSVGEPLNEEAWHWYDEKVGKSNCPIVDTWWQTETGGFMISPIAGVTPLKPSFAGLPLPGVQVVLVDEKGTVIKENDAGGNLCITFPWPGMMRTTYGDHDRFRQTYFSAYPGKYFTGDGALRDPDGYYRITGRVDDVINVSGHRIGTAEVENALNMHNGVVESAVVGYPHPIKGQGIYAYVILGQGDQEPDYMRRGMLETVSRLIGSIARPDLVQFVSALPKTRSGKIMRRILRKIAEGDSENMGDISTLQDPAVVEEIIQGSLVQKAAKT